jgi:Na+-transporting NADH:ubiquinone oxidoreductase subunit C
VPQPNKDSNIYIFSFLAIMIVVVAVLLVGITSSLRPMQKENEANYLRKNILAAVMDVNGIDVGAVYNEKITEYVIDAQGNLVEGASAFNLADNATLAKEYKKPEAERNYPLFLFSTDTADLYIIPLTGNGLWDRIYGFIGVKGDFNTVVGTSFGHVAETPGLGAEIEREKFNSQFPGKELFNESGEYALTVYKAGQAPDNEYSIDGLSGATVTTDGADLMLRRCIVNYLPYFESGQMAKN